MHAKFKLSTFVHKSVPNIERESLGFRQAVLLLPELYVAHISPAKTSWVPSGNSRPMKDEFMFFPSDYFFYMNEGFQCATRAESHILPGLICIIEFFSGSKTTGRKVTLSIHTDGHIGAGFLN